MPQVHQLRASAQSALQEWKACNKLYDEANVVTIQLAYSMEHSKPAVLSMEALDCQVQNLQVSQPAWPKVLWVKKLKVELSIVMNTGAFLLFTQKQKWWHRKYILNFLCLFHGL